MLSQRSKILAQYFYIFSVIFVCGGFFLAFITYNLITPVIIGYKLYSIFYYLWLLIPIAFIFYFLLFLFRMYLNLNAESFKSDIIKLFEITVISVFLIYAVLFMFKVTYVSRLFLRIFPILVILGSFLSFISMPSLLKSFINSSLNSSLPEYIVLNL